jgi:hypothetical protein
MPGAILEKWKLPAAIQQAVAYHHTPAQANEGLLHLAHAVEAADCYVNSAGFGMAPYRHHPAVSFGECDLGFGLKEQAVEAAESFQAEFEAVRAHF